jgi:hypothetical protein
MGQPVTVIEKPARRGGVVRYELNRVLTGTGHEIYRSGDVIAGDRPPDELARRLFAHGGIDTISINSSVVTVDLSKGGHSDGLKEIIEDLYTYYRPGVEVPSFPTEDEGGEAADS